MINLYSDTIFLQALKFINYFVLMVSNERPYWQWQSLANAYQSLL